MKPTGPAKIIMADGREFSVNCKLDKLYTSTIPKVDDMDPEAMARAANAVRDSITKVSFEFLSKTFGISEPPSDDFIDVESEIVPNEIKLLEDAK